MRKDQQVLGEKKKKKKKKSTPLAQTIPLQNASSYVTL